MDFEKPSGQFPKGSIQSFIGLEFKKSVFFAGNYVICLGSNITSTNNGPYFTQARNFLCKISIFIHMFSSVNVIAHEKIVYVLHYESIVPDVRLKLWNLPLQQHVLRGKKDYQRAGKWASRRKPGHIREFNRLEPHSSYDLVFKIWRNNKTEATLRVFCLWLWVSQFSMGTTGI